MLLASHLRKHIYIFGHPPASEMVCEEPHKHLSITSNTFSQITSFYKFGLGWFFCYLEVIKSPVYLQIYKKREWCLEHT